MEQDRPQKAGRITESRRQVRCGRWCFVISPGSIPLKSIVSRDVVFTLQEKLFGLDSVKRLYLVTGIIIQSGTTECSAFVIQLEIG